MIMPPTVATLLPLKAIIQLLPGAVAQPYSLQQYAVYTRLLLGGIQQLVGSGSSVPGSLLPPLELLVNPVGFYGDSASDSLLHLALAEWDRSCHMGFLRGSPGSGVSGLVAPDAHMAGRLGIQLSLTSRPCATRLQAAQDGGDEAHNVVGLQDLQPRPAVGVQHHGVLFTVLGMLKGQLDGHQLCLQCGAVVRCPGKQLRASGLPLSGSTKPSV